MGFDVPAHVRVVLLAVFAVSATLLSLALLDRDGMAARASLFREPVSATSSPISSSLENVSEALADGNPAAAGTQGQLVSNDPREATVPQPEPKPACDEGSLVVDIDRSLPIRANPGSGRTIGTMPATTKYFGSRMVAWVRRTEGRHGLVTIPWSTAGSGWIDISGLRRTYTNIRVTASLAKRQIVVRRGCNVVLRAPAAIGADVSPSPRGMFWVTDPTPVPASQPQFGSYAFGLSTIQPNLPPGWTGGNQMAIHGTNAPASIGTPASAGCLRVSENTLDRLRSLLTPGTPVSIVR